MGKKIKIIWSPAALSDLQDAFDYIAQDSQERATKWTLEMRQSVVRLEMFPLSGRKVPELPEAGLREVITGDYRIFYEIRKGKLSILRVLHGRRFFEGSFF